MLILAADIGGTNTRLSLFDEKKQAIKSKTYSSKNHASLAEILKEFIDQKVDVASFGIAGPIKNNVCKTTNLPWVIDGKALGKELDIEKVYLINDLLANAYGIRALKEEEFFVLNSGHQREGNQALVSAGTGLGEAGLFWNGKEYFPFPSEGGHADFAPQTEEQVELMQFLKEEYGHVSFERTLSGPGLYDLYRFFHEKKQKPGFDQEPDKKEIPKLISSNAKNSPEASKLALDLFISIYGAEAGNVALKFLSLGGLYLGGGIAPHVAEKMKEGIFMKSFTAKGRFEELLQDIPVKVIMNDQTALLGALEYALTKNTV